jgi:hypothetical protein
MQIYPVLTTHTDLKKIVYSLMHKSAIDEFILDDLLNCIDAHQKASQ